MPDRRQNSQEVLKFLQDHFSCQSWKLTLPKGTGNETYFAHSNEQIYFVKLGVQISRYQAMDSIGVIPQILATGYLENGTPIIVQVCIVGKTPSRKDFHDNLELFASIISKTHHSSEVMHILSKPSSNLYSKVGLEALARIQQRWNYFKSQVPTIADFVDDSLDYLEQQVRDFQGSGLVASHNDICNANWLITPDRQLYLLDLESMSLDDPAFDIGAILWWYYPPNLREDFIRIAGYRKNTAFERRMRVRMAMHCLNITLPRKNSFDRFDRVSFSESLTDFRAALAGEENPQGYE